MTTAMITTCLTGLVRAVGVLFSVLISSASIYFLLFSEKPEEAGENPYTNPDRSKLLFSGASCDANENGVCNPYRFKLLFSEAFYNAKENGVCNPYRFKNASKLTAKAVGFIFFINPENYQSSFLRRNVTTVCGQGTRKPTTCL